MTQKPEIPNFLVFDVPAVKQQNGRPMRGLAIRIETHLCSNFVNQTLIIDSLVISLSDIRTSLCCMYSPPKTNLENIQYIMSNCLVIITRDDISILIGDFK